MQIWLGYGDALTHPFRVTIPTPTPTVHVRGGAGPDGRPGPVLARLGVHTLVAGATGAGKASAVHGLLIGLGPAIKAGVVQVHGST